MCILGALALPALQLKTGETELPRGLPVAETESAIEHAFPGAPEDAQLVVRGGALDAPAAGRELQALGERAMAVTGGRGQVRVTVAPDARTAVVAVPMPERSHDATKRTVAALRDRVAPTAAQVGPGAEALVTGAAAEDADFEDRLASRTPLVLLFVLGLAFVLLVAAFRSVPLAARDDRPEPAVARRDLRDPQRRVPERVGRGPARLRVRTAWSRPGCRCSRS